MTNQDGTKWAECPHCGRSVRIPETPVRNTGLLRCFCDRLFRYKGDSERLDRRLAELKGGQS